MYPDCLPDEDDPPTAQRERFDGSLFTRILLSAAAGLLLVGALTKIGESLIALL